MWTCIYEIIDDYNMLVNLSLKNFKKILKKVIAFKMIYALE